MTVATSTPPLTQVTGCLLWWQLPWLPSRLHLQDIRLISVNTIRRHEHCFNWLTCSLSIRHRPLVTPAGVYWVCPESFTLNKVTHCSSMQTLIKSVSTLQRSLASAGSDLLYNRAPEIHSRKLLLKDCWMNTSLGHGLFSLNLPVSRLPLCVPVCVRVC